MSSITKTQKISISDDIVNKLIQIIMNIETMEKAIDVFFNIESLIKNESVKKYLENDMGNVLRKCMYVRKCTKISKEHEKMLTETDLITILRSVMKEKGYKLAGFTDSRAFQGCRYYKILLA